MNRKTLIVAANEGFIIKGLETKLEGIGVASSFSQPVMKDIREKCEGTGLIILFTDDAIGDIANTLVFIKDYCSEHNEQVIVIGAKTEYDVLKGYIPSSLIYQFFERPLDMEQLLNEIEKYMEEESQYARLKSILIVDDDVSYMSIISEWLKGSYRVSMANSGMQAITWLAKNHADLILLDYEMPITPGPQVLEMIRSDTELADIPVMFLTGKSDKESIMKVLALKPVGYLLKTVDKKELNESIGKYFATHNA
ncbi:MAG: response regulator [Lachnospiraceae bacterium]|nr:response regulator [Lachnospiraceae bacterium]